MVGLELNLVIDKNLLQIENFGPYSDKIVLVYFYK